MAFPKEMTDEVFLCVAPFFERADNIRPYGNCGEYRLFSFLIIQFYYIYVKFFNSAPFRLDGKGVLI